MGLNVRQFHDLILEPTLQSLYPAIPHGDVARLLVLETMWHESGGLRHIKQVGGGPALGLGQCELLTFAWLMDELKTRQSLRGILGRLGAFSPNWPSIQFEELAWNLKLAVAFVRLRYYVVPAALPTPESGVTGRANYWGRFYQTSNDVQKIFQYIDNASQLPQGYTTWGSP